ncbi:MAG: gamma-glutamyl-gamma-aminobutyrate hydrolase family protein [Pseudomonadota bacterium]
MSANHPTILIILHQATSKAGRVGTKLIQRGFALDIRRPPLGDDLPDTMENHAGVVVFGGPGSANDPDEWVKRETDWLSVPLREEKPLFGICLGAQMLANHLGGSVYQRPDKMVEIGWYPLNDEDDIGQFGPWPDIVYHFHREGLTAPDSCKILASSELYPHQAFCLNDRTVAIQFHVELTQAMMQAWTVRGAHRFDLPNAQGKVDHLNGRLIHDHLSEVWLDRFLDKWIGTAANPTLPIHM